MISEAEARAKILEAVRSLSPRKLSVSDAYDHFAGADRDSGECPRSPHRARVASLQPRLIAMLRPIRSSERKSSEVGVELQVQESGLFYLDKSVRGT